LQLKKERTNPHGLDIPQKNRQTRGEKKEAQKEKDENTDQSQQRSNTALV